MTTSATNPTRDSSALGKNLADAEMLFEDGKYQQCEKILKAALNQDPSNALVLNNLGAVYAKLGKKDQGLDLLRKALNNPDFVFANQVIDISGKLIQAREQMQQSREQGQEKKSPDWEYWKTALEATILNNIDWIEQH